LKTIKGVFLKISSMAKNRGKGTSQKVFCKTNCSIKQKGFKGNPGFGYFMSPNYREVARGTLRAIIRQAGLSLDAFAELLKK
jgi:hypothetical protein